MPRLDAHHEIVKRALVKDGWEITDDPLVLVFKDIALYADIGAEKAIGAAKDGRKIAVEIKGFSNESKTDDLHHAKGQHDFYLFILRRTEPERTLYLAVPDVVWNKFFQRPAVQEFMVAEQVKFLVYNVENEEVVEWKH